MKTREFKDMRNAYSRAYYRMHKRQLLAHYKKYRDTHKKSRLAYYKNYRAAHLDRIRNYGRYVTEADRIRAFDVLGGQCKCGDTNPFHLQIDHIAPIHQIAKHRVCLHTIYRKIADGKKMPNIQLLCANCHAEKTIKESMRNDGRNY